MVRQSTETDCNFYPNSRHFVDMSSTPTLGNTEGDYVHGACPEGRDTEAAPSKSDDSQNELNRILSSGYEIDVYRVGVNGNRQLVSSEGQSPAYFVRNSVFRPGVPDVTIFAGSDKKGTVVGVCNFAAFSSSVFVGRGDPAKPQEVEWEAASKASRDHSTYQFSISLRPGQRKSYMWKRTHDPNIKGTKSSKFNKRSWKLVDDTTGQVVAAFASDGMKSWKKAGSFRFFASEGKEWEEWMLLACFGLYEKARRRAMARRDMSWFI